MPFVSPEQEAYLRIHHPEIHRKWLKEYGHAPVNRKKRKKVGTTPFAVSGAAKSLASSLSATFNTKPSPPPRRGGSRGLPRGGLVPHIRATSGWDPGRAIEVVDLVTGIPSFIKDPSWGSGAMVATGFIPFGRLGAAAAKLRNLYKIARPAYDDSKAIFALNAARNSGSWEHQLVRKDIDVNFGASRLADMLYKAEKFGDFDPEDLASTTEFIGKKILDKANSHFRNVAKKQGPEALNKELLEKGWYYDAADKKYLPLPGSHLYKPVESRPITPYWQYKGQAATKKSKIIRLDTGVPDDLEKDLPYNVALRFVDFDEQWPQVSYTAYLGAKKLRNIADDSGELSNRFEGIVRIGREIGLSESDLEELESLVFRIGVDDFSDKIEKFKWIESTFGQKAADEALRRERLVRMPDSRLEPWPTNPDLIEASKVRDKVVDRLESLGIPYSGYVAESAGEYLSALVDKTSNLLNRHDLINVDPESALLSVLNSRPLRSATRVTFANDLADYVIKASDFPLTKGEEISLNLLRLSPIRDRVASAMADFVGEKQVNELFAKLAFRRDIDFRSPDVVLKEVYNEISRTQPNFMNYSDFVQRVGKADEPLLDAVSNELNIGEIEAPEFGSYYDESPEVEGVNPYSAIPEENAIFSNVEIATDRTDIPVWGFDIESVLKSPQNPHAIMGALDPQFIDTMYDYDSPQMRRILNYLARLRRQSGQ